MTIAENEAAVWETFDDAGWLVAALWKGATVKVFFVKPGQITANGAQSTGYEITYQTADMATLKEGDAITVDGTKFKVRETPMVSPVPGESRTGYFKHALLTSLK